MTRTRIAFLDVDGTILEHGSVIAPSTVTAIRTARAAGHQVWLCTGRADADIHPEVREIGFDGIISNGGAYATRDGVFVLERPMPRVDVEAIETHLRDHGIPYFLQTHDAVFASPGIAEVTAEYFDRIRRERLSHLTALGHTPSSAPTLDRYRPLAEVDRDRVAKAVFISPDTQALASTSTLLDERFDVIPGSIPLPAGSNGEIGLVGVTKGSAILEVLDLLGIDPVDAIGIGDSWNDVPMFEVVGTAIAMGNAARELQTLAGEVTTAVLDDGIHNAFDRMGLI